MDEWAVLSQPLGRLYNDGNVAHSSSQTISARCLTFILDMAEVNAFESSHLLKPNILESVLNVEIRLFWLRRDLQFWFGLLI
jgi:hypothetical protein